jgi:hypothetical protein
MENIRGDLATFGSFEQLPADGLELEHPLTAALAKCEMGCSDESRVLGGPAEDVLGEHVVRDVVFRGHTVRPEALGSRGCAVAERTASLGLRAPDG